MTVELAEIQVQRGRVQKGPQAFRHDYFEPLSVDVNVVNMILKTHRTGRNTIRRVDASHHSPSFFLRCETLGQDIYALGNKQACRMAVVFNRVGFLGRELRPSDKQPSKVAWVNQRGPALARFLSKVFPHAEIYDPACRDCQAKRGKRSVQYADLLASGKVLFRGGNMDERFRILGRSNLVGRQGASANRVAVRAPALRNADHPRGLGAFDGMQDDVLLQDLVVLERGIPRIKDVNVS